MKLSIIYQASVITTLTTCDIIACQLSAKWSSNIGIHIYQILTLLQASIVIAVITLGANALGLPYLGAFGIIAVVIMMLIFDRKDLRLGAIAISAVFSHMSFDIFLGGSTEFPLFVPWNSQVVTFSGTDWIIFEFVAISIIFVSSVIFLKKAKDQRSRNKV